MAIRLCVHNHYYDDEKYVVCPICLRAAQDGAPDATLTVGQGEETAAYGPLQEDPAARPVVGWLVCVEGEERGRDWRLSDGRNDIGTAAPADILLRPAAAPGEGRLCSVVYDGRHKAFALAPERGAIVYYNGQLLTGPAALQDGDEIGVEGYLLCFQSFCGIQKDCW